MQELFELRKKLETFNRQLINVNQKLEKCKEQIRKVNKKEEHIKSLKSDLKEFITSNASYFYYILKEGYDCRNKGLRWVIVKLLQLNKSVVKEDLPVYLKDSHKDYLIKISNYDYLKIKTLSKINDERDLFNKTEVLNESKYCNMVNTDGANKKSKIIFNYHNDRIAHKDNKVLKISNSTKNSNILISESNDSNTTKGNGSLYRNLSTNNFFLSNDTYVDTMTKQYKSELYSIKSKIINTSGNMNYIKNMHDKSNSIEIRTNPYTGQSAKVDHLLITEENIVNEVTQTEPEEFTVFDKDVIIKLRNFSLLLTKKINDLFENQLKQIKYERNYLIKNSFTIRERVEFDLISSALFGTYIRY